MLKLEACIPFSLLGLKYQTDTSMHPFITTTTSLVIQDPRLEIEPKPLCLTEGHLGHSPACYFSQNEVSPYYTTKSDQQAESPHVIAYPTPVEGASKVIPSAKWKDSHRRRRAELQLIKDGEDPAHL